MTYACRYPLKAVHIFPNTKDTPCCRFHQRFLRVADETKNIQYYDNKDKTINIYKMMKQHG